MNHIVEFAVTLPSATGSVVKICTLPEGAFSSIRPVSLSVACERSADRTGRQEAFVAYNGDVYLQREKAASGPVYISGSWHV